MILWAGSFLRNHDPFIPNSIHREPPLSRHINIPLCVPRTIQGRHVCNIEPRPLARQLRDRGHPVISKSDGVTPGSTSNKISRPGKAKPRSVNRKGGEKSVLLCATARLRQFASLLSHRPSRALTLPLSPLPFSGGSWLPIWIRGALDVYNRAGETTARGRWQATRGR